jgi:transcription initiation factor IIE alpha subunit
MDNEEKIKKMEEHISNLETELQTTKEHLKKYTAPASRKVYYERNKEQEKQRAKEYKENTNYKSTPEQVKLYNQRAYLRRKEKLKTEMEEKQNDETI